jgi:hypothetical protein
MHECGHRHCIRFHIDGNRADETTKAGKHEVYRLPLVGDFFQLKYSFRESQLYRGVGIELTWSSSSHFPMENGRV